MFRKFTRTLLAGFVLCLMQAVAYGQTPDWKWQNPLLHGNPITDIQFVGSQKGWAVAPYGAILHTTNGGQTWQTQSSGRTNLLKSVHFIDSLSGWVVGELGTILKTIDGGNLWQSQNSGTTQSLRSIFFVNQLRGWVVSGTGSIMRTVDGGITWQNQYQAGFWLESVHFVNANTGIVVGQGGNILRTTNGGIDWEERYNGSVTDFFYAISFISPTVGWTAGNNGAILKTTNAGNTWTIQAPGLSANILNIYFMTAQIGWAVTDLGTILKTSNGGSNWQSLSSGTTHRLYSLHLDDAQTGWVGGDYGIIMKTTNGGSSWQFQHEGTNEHLNSVNFNNVLTGWAVGNNGTILKTSSGGSTWQSQISGTTNELRSVYFINPQLGFVVGSNGSILKTTNGGSNWLSQSTGTTNSLLSVHFINSETGWAVGMGGTILKTSNSGSTWQSQISGTTNELRAVHFNDIQTGCAVGLSGTILKTSNGGSSWQSLTSGTTRPLNSIHFINAQNGWVVGALGTIMRTINGGESWQAQTSGTSGELTAVKFLDSQIGWAVGFGGTILKTINGGQSWQRQYSGTDNHLKSVHATDLLRGWAVGDGGTILTTFTNNPIDPTRATSLITGKLFEKTNGNCNPSNIPVVGKIVKANPGLYYGISNQNGNYELRVPLADTASNFTLQPVVNSSTALQIETVCPPSGQIQAVLDLVPDTISDNNFGFEITPCHHLDLQLASNFRRRCFSSSTSINYFNQGALPAPNAYIQVEFPKWVRPVSASRSYVAVNDSVWQFNLGDVPAGSGGQFSITDVVICGNLNILDLSQCTRASIFPPPNCPPPTAWSRAEVSLSGSCQSQGIAQIGIYNRTLVNMPDSVDYFIYLDSIEVRSGKVKLVASDSLKFQVETTGHDAHITAIQVANHPTQAYVSLTLEGCTATTTEPRGIAMHFPIQQQPNSKTQCLPIIGAYDPNDKQVFPLGFTANRIVPPNTKLEYLVRFQNTGNDTAFTVYIIDTLHTNLNVESFEMGAASHPYQLSMQTTKSGKTWLRWQFNNILLPDSGTNQLASNGFVQFRISPKANLPLGTQVYNEADIYFDFNPPILTNQTLTTFDIIRFTDTTLNRNVRVILPTGIPAALRNAMKLYPNPVTNNQLNINFAEAGSLTLYDARGQVVYSKANLIGEHTLPVSLKRGMYVARIQSAGGSWSEKVVVE